MKFFERILPTILKSHPLVYNLTVIALCFCIFIVLLFVGAILSIFVTFIIDSILKQRGQDLAAAGMSVMLLLIFGAALADFIFCIIILGLNLKW